MITGATLLDEEASSLLNCMERGENDYLDYRKSRIIDKNKSLFDTISFKTNRKKNKRTKKSFDLTKVHAEFTRTIDIAQVRGYSVRNLLSYELTLTSHFLTKEGFLTKSPKSELLELMRKQQMLDSEFTPSSKETAIIIIDFIAQAWKIESWQKKDKVKTFGDALLEIWKSCTQMMSSSKHVDFVFDLYLEDSIKSLDRQRRSMTNEST